MTLPCMSNDDACWLVRPCLLRRQFDEGHGTIEKLEAKCEVIKARAEGFVEPETLVKP